jgi:hypothetical protein
VVRALKSQRLEAFLGNQVRPLLPQGLAFVSRLGWWFFLPASAPTHLHPLNQSWAGLPRCVPSSLLSSGSGMLTGCPSPTPCGLGLGPTNPTRIDLPSETLDFRRTRFSRVLRYSCLHSHFCPLQPSFQSTFSADRTLPYCEGILHAPTHGFGVKLSPVMFSAQDHLTSELLRTLLRMAASKPTSWLSV